MNLKGKKILVTGAGGFIGSHLVESLVENGAKVKALVHYNSRNDWGNLEYIDKKIIKEVQIVLGDIVDPICVRKVVNDCQLVFHLAALIGIPYSYFSPKSYVDTNVYGTLNILQTCLESGVEKIIHTSTSETYGSAQYTPIDEKHPLVGQSPYAATKISADKLAESFYLSFNLPVTIVRPFNTYGPRQSPRAVIPTIITQILVGNVVKLGSLDTIRDFNFVKDTVNGFLKIAQNSKSDGEVINIGSGREYSIKELFNIIKGIIKKDVKLLVDKKRIRPEKSEVKALICDYKKAKKLAQYEPNYTLRQGLAETIEYFKNAKKTSKEDNYII